MYLIKNHLWCQFTPFCLYLPSFSHSYSHLSYSGLPLVRKWSGKQIFKIKEKSKFTNWHFEEKSGKSEIIEHSWFNTIDCCKKHFGSLWSRYFYFMKSKENFLEACQCCWMSWKGRPGCHAYQSQQTDFSCLATGSPHIRFDKRSN